MDDEQKVLDLTRDLRVAARTASTVAEVDELLRVALEALSKHVEYDLATLMELREDELRVRIACGSLASDQVLSHRLRLSEYPGIRTLLGAETARAFTEHDHAYGDGDAFDGVINLPYGHSCMVAPLSVRGQPLGILTFDREKCGKYPDAVVELTSVFGQLIAMAMGYGEQSTLLTRVSSQLKEQNRLLDQKVIGGSDACALLEASQSIAMARVVRQAKQVASTDAPVLITGETGTGKEVLANAIHGWSSRTGQPIVGINCAALPSSLIESELFGHVKGAFSGATKTRIGRFQAANGGTLFLDEIGELPIDLQPKFLRALQEGRYEAVGSDRTTRVDVRIIAATNQDLLTSMAKGTFRDDLYYRIAVFPIHLPPLRDRQEDIIVIADNFLDALSVRTGRGPWWLSEDSKEWLQSQSWPGNVRELVNTLERATIVTNGSELRLGQGGLDIDEPYTNPSAEPKQEEQPLVSLVEMERRHIQRALRHTGGKLYGEDGAAAILGINPNTLRSRMKKLGLGGARSYRDS